MSETNEPRTLINIYYAGNPDIKGWSDLRKVARRHANSQHAENLFLTEMLDALPDAVDALQGAVKRNGRADPENLIDEAQSQRSITDRIKINAGHKLIVWGVDAIQVEADLGGRKAPWLGAEKSAITALGAGLLINNIVSEIRWADEAGGAEFAANGFSPNMRNFVSDMHRKGDYIPSAKAVTQVLKQGFPAMPSGYYNEVGKLLENPATLAPTPKRESVSIQRTALRRLDS